MFFNLSEYSYDDFENIGNGIYNVKKPKIITKLKRFNYEDENNPSTENRTTAFLEKDTRKTVVFAKNGAKFILANAGNHIFGLNTGKRHNINEYENINSNQINIDKGARGFINDKSLGKIHFGNFSIIYEIQLIAAQGKKMIVKPYFAGRQASFLLYINGEWKAYFFPFGLTKYKSSYFNIITKESLELPIPKDGFFKFILPGANNGDVFFNIID